MEEIFPIIGMSPGNSYFKDEEVRYLLQKIIGQYGKCAVLVADIPAISTYEALGYPTNKARNKAIPKGNNLKNRTRRIQKELNIADDSVRIIEWEEEVENNLEYQEYYQQIQSLFDINVAFAKDARATTQEVIDGSENNNHDNQQAIDIAVHYLLSEFAFLEWAHSYLGKEKIAYVYHKNWSVFEKYIAGVYDDKKRPYLEFILLENPYETFIPLKGVPLHNVQADSVIRASFSHYPPAFINKNGAYSGVFHDLLINFAKTQNLTIEWVEETGYGAIVDGLNDGRFDIFASAVWPISERKEVALFSESIYRSPVYLWIRDGEKFDNKTMNTKEFSIAIRENDISDSLKKAHYPLARIVHIPQLGTMDVLLNMVSTGTADATFAEPYIVEQYNDSAHIKLSPYNKTPICIFDNSFLLSKDNATLCQLLNAYIVNQKKNGTIDLLLKTYAGLKPVFNLLEKRLQTVQEINSGHSESSNR